MKMTMETMMILASQMGTESQYPVIDIVGDKKYMPRHRMCRTKKSNMKLVSKRTKQKNKKK